jgi:cobalt-zinc-cadmium efflux system outer membrane protein
MMIGATAWNGWPRKKLFKTSPAWVVCLLPLASAWSAQPLRVVVEDLGAPVASPLERLADDGQSLGELPVPPDAAFPPETPPTDAARRSIASVTGSRSPEAGMVRLVDYEAQAERLHPRLRAAQAAIEAARGKAVQVRLYPNPVIAGFTPQAAGSDSQWSGTVAQDIVTAGKLRLQQQAALREVQRTRYEFVRARFDVLTGVREAFYSLLVAQRRAEIYRMLLDIAKRSYDIGEQLAEAGEGTKADVLFWSIEYDRARVRVLNADVLVETGRRELAAAAAVPRESIPWVEGDLLADLPDFDLPGLQEEVLLANALPRAASAEVARARWALDRALVQPIPNVNLMGGYQRQVDNPPQDQGLAQVMLAVPLFDRNQGNIRSARADIAQAQAGLRGVELDLAMQTAQAIADYRTAQRMVAWYEESILPKARETVEIMQRLYGQGEVNFLRLLEAQRILTETELAFIEAQERRWTGAVSIASLLQLEEFPPRGDEPASRSPPKVSEDEVRPLPPIREAAGGGPPRAAEDAEGRRAVP